jgi:ribosomal protein S18 acetylase RimI-like enzyme
LKEVIMDVATIVRQAETPVIAKRFDFEQIVHVLAAAFAEDPVLAWIMRDAATRDAMRRDFFQVIVEEAAYSKSEIEWPAAGGAVAIWRASEEIHPPPLHRELRALPVFLRAAGLRRFGRLLSLRKAMDDNHPMQRPHDYLWFLGVHPKAQSNGIGSRLLQSHCAKLDAQHRGAFLETGMPRNVPFYERFGFSVVKEYMPAPGGPLMWAMWREPVAGSEKV